MAEITRPRVDAQIRENQTAEGSPLRLGKSQVIRLAVGLGVVVLLVVCLAVWGPGMEYPTTVSSSEITTSSGGTIELTKTVRDVTGTAIRRCRQVGYKGRQLAVQRSIRRRNPCPDKYRKGTEVDPVAGNHIGNFDTRIRRGPLATGNIHSCRPSFHRFQWACGRTPLIRWP